LASNLISRPTSITRDPINSHNLDPNATTASRAHEAPESSAPDQLCYPDDVVAPQPDTQTRKRLSSVDEGPVKRRCRTRLETRRLEEARETAALRESLGKNGLSHAFSYRSQTKEWEIEDIEDVNLERDGSIRYLVKWKPTVVTLTALAGEPV
jgi:hypothetical protein